MQNIHINSSKINFIYNATSEPAEDKAKKSNDSNKTSIEIEFSSRDYHILIRNQEKLSPPPLLDDMKESNELNLSNSFFNVNEDVLMEDDDGKFYLGTIINAKSENYLIRFDDNTEKWSNYCNLKKLNASPTKNGVDSSLCVVCKVSKEFDVVEICDKCSRGYHRQCIKEDNPPSSSRWNCSRCSFDVISISDSEELESVSAEEFIDHKSLPSLPIKFSYDVSPVIRNYLHNL